MAIKYNQYTSVAGYQRSIGEADHFEYLGVKDLL